MIRRILVGLGDLEHSQTATTQAIALAQSHDAELTGVTLFDSKRLDHRGIVPIGAGAAAKELSDSRLTSASEVIEAATAIFENRCHEAGVSHVTVHESGDPMTSLASHARYHDLIIVGFHGLFEHGVLDEPHDELAMLVKAGVRPLVAVPKLEHDVNRVLIAYSGSMESAKTMKRFIQLRLWPEASVRVVTFRRRSRVGSELVEQAAEYLQAHGVDPEVDSVDLTPRDNILPYAAECDADLIVMGNSARNLLIRKFLGATALHVMRNSDRMLFLAQ